MEITSQGITIYRLMLYISNAVDNVNGVKLVTFLGTFLKDDALHMHTILSENATP